MPNRQYSVPISSAPGGGPVQNADIPAWLSEGQDNSVIRGAVDGSGNPSYGSVTNGVFTVQGGTTNLECWIDNYYQKVTDSASVAVTLTNSAVNFVYLIRNTSSTILGASDIGVTTNPPVFGNLGSAPSTTNATSSNPVLWFNAGINHWQQAVSNGGSFSNVSIMPLAVVITDSGGASLGMAFWGPRWTPWKVMEVCGQGTAGQKNVSSGTSTVTGCQFYSSFVCRGGTVNPVGTVQAGNAGVAIFSQAPVVICNSGVVSATGFGYTGGGATTGNGNWGQNGTFGGAGGGGGGSSAHAGGFGGSNMRPAGLGVSGAATLAFSTFSGGAQGSTGPGAGGTGPSAGTTGVPLAKGIATGCLGIMSAHGGGGGAGGGDNSNNGGAGATGGGQMFICAPGYNLVSGASHVSNGNVGGNAAGGNSAGAGGGGGGYVGVYAGYYIIGGTQTATGGSGGSGAGTGAAGGQGGNGLVENVRVL